MGGPAYHQAYVSQDAEGWSCCANCHSYLYVEGDDGEDADADTDIDASQMTT